MNRIQQVFSQGKAFVAYLTAGQKGLERTLQAANALITGGVNMLEIGVPFSDPIADGPVIQAAMNDALQRQTTLEEILTLAQQLRQQYPQLPLILFSYYNPIFQASKYQATAFFQRMKQAGFDAVLVVDLGLNEALPFVDHCQQAKLAPIFVVTPDTTIARIKKIQQIAAGFIYYACRKGTTGMKNSLPDDFSQRLNQLKSHTTLPVVVGFGITNKSMVRNVLACADGFVVGSKFVDAIENEATSIELTQLASTFIEEENLCC